MHHSRELALFLSFVFGILLLPVKSDEIQDNKYTFTFKDITTKTWTDDGKTEKFKNSMATVANDYCSNNYDKCSLKFWNSTRNFTSAHVKISSGYPKQVDDNLQIQFHVELPYGTDIRKNDTTIIPVASLKVIISAKASTLSSLVGVEVMNNDDGDTTSTPKPKVDNTLNYIMIPVSFGILLIVLILAICLHCCHKRKMEEIKAAERRQYSSTKKARNSNSQSPFLVSHVPVVAVKPQKRADTETHVQYEDETNSHYGEYVLQHTPSPETQSPHKRKKKKKSQRDKKRKENIEKENGHIYEGGEEDLEQNHNKVIEDENSDDSDNERQPVKERRRKKKRHKRKVESLCSQEEGESDREEGGVERTVESDDISTRLPPPRKLPPLRATPDNEANANND